MSKRGIDDPESGAYEDDARELERELAAVVRRVLAEELEKPEFRRKLESTVAKAIREVVGAQKRALREEGEGLRRSLGSGARAGQEEDLLRGERGPKPVASGKTAGWGERREEGSWLPRRFHERIWIPWLLGGCLVLVVAGGVWFAMEKFHPRNSGETVTSFGDALNDPGQSAGSLPGEAEDAEQPDAAAGTEGAGSSPASGALDAIWLREIRAAEGGLAAGSPLFASTAQARLDCFFPQTTRDRLARRAGQLDGDLAGDFGACVREKYPLAANTPNAAVFAAQTLARKLLVTKGRSGLTWCSTADLGAVQLSRFKPDGVTGPTTFTVLRAAVPCLGVKGLTFDAKSPVEAYLALSYTALGEIARLAPEG
ncbi:MAG TPA: hypothetical protein VGS22_16105 [Thermoanaerobaculia bacterium]|jgi:hypothetical protein|nr:hypothetical protein [Thermoanaerobaculia bacterium]